MDLGVRQIRSSGKGSGSIELTLPSDLRELVGLQCRVLWRDGSRPDIVLQPDLRSAHRAFAALWHSMAALLFRDDTNTPGIPLGSFVFALQPRPGSDAMPFLCWRDGLALAAAAPHDPSGIARTLWAFGRVMAARLQIDPSLADGFGAACGYLVSGVPATPDAQESCDLVAAALFTAHPVVNGGKARFRGSEAADACAAGVLSPAFWCHATPLLAATAELFLGWTADPSSHAALRAAWRRGRTIEMSGE